MAKSEAVNVFASLQRKEQIRNASGTLSKARVFIEFEAEDLWFNPDEEAIAQVAAVAIAKTIQSNMLTGHKPDGTPLPAADEATVERRAYRDAQAASGGRAPRWAGRIASAKDEANEARRAERAYQKNTK